MELDNEIFQLATLGGLVLLLLILLLVLSSLGRVHKALKAGPAPGITPSPGQNEAAGLAAPEPAGAGYATSGYPPSGAAQPAAYSPEPAAAMQPATYAAQPVATQPAAAAATPITAQEPQDQPFERDGRWWFRRGNELLVYDEQSAQWVPAPAQTVPGVAGPPTTGAGPESAEAGFWKCPSCGAINGSTATSCRMCFTARP